MIKLLILTSPSQLLEHITAKAKHIILAPATGFLLASHTVRMAEEYALLDLLSNGRAQLLH